MKEKDKKKKIKGKKDEGKEKILDKLWYPSQKKWNIEIEQIMTCHGYFTGKKICKREEKKK